MKYKVKKKKNINLLQEGELLNTILEDRGISDPSHYLNLTDDDILDGVLLKNMYEGLCMLKWHIDNGSHIHIIIDCDCDGVTSASMMYNYLKRISPSQNITFHMNQGKAHGIIKKQLEGYLEDVMLLIVPDAGSNDIEEVGNILKEYDLDILCLDHHIIDNSIDTFGNVELINNQDGQYPNTTLSGAGVVYKFIKEYDKIAHFNYADDYLDLCALGLVGDSMDIRNYETRRLVKKKIVVFLLASLN